MNSAFFQVRSTLHKIAEKSNLLLLCDQWRTHWGVFGVKTPHRRFKIKTSLFETIRLFSYRVYRNYCHVFLCYPTCLLISRNFHGDAIIPVVKLFWWAALEPTTNTKCKPGQSQWVVLKLESCCDVMKGLFSTANQGWTTQRSSAGGILEKEWLQRRRMFRW